VIPLLTALFKVQWLTLVQDSARGSSHVVHR
jgi:hypothetical protein